MTNNLPTSGELVIRPASFNDIVFIQEIAYATWPVAYGNILSSDQLSYMLDLIYSKTALEEQVKDNHHFFLAIKDAGPVGFASFSHTGGDVYKLQKIYVLPGTQGTGAGNALLTKVETIVKSMGGSRLQLNVNRLNKAQDFYINKGFTILREEDIPIGNGYFMNDYIMEKIIS